MGISCIDLDLLRNHNYLLQTNAPLEEARKNIWLVDSKVVHIPLYSSYLLNLIVNFHLSNFLILFLQGLIVSSRKETLQHFKKPWAHEHEPVKNLLDAVNVCSLALSLPVILLHIRVDNFQILTFPILFSQQIKPTVLIGTSGQGRTFTKEVVKAMATINKVYYQSINLFTGNFISTEAS